MRINAAEQTRATGKARAKRKQASGAFAPHSQASSQSTAPMATTQTNPIASLDALIALQGDEDFRQARKKATARADELLDVLSDMRLGLLEGGVSMRTLQRLSTTLERTRANTGDARLEAILNEVEIRAEVEKAKLDSVT